MREYLIGSKDSEEDPEQKRDYINYRYRKSIAEKFNNFISKYYQSKLTEENEGGKIKNIMFFIFIEDVRFIKIMSHGEYIQIYIYNDIEPILQEYIESILDSVSSDRIGVSLATFFNVFEIKNTKSISIEFNGDDYEFLQATQQYNL
jgi:hypothetical protein